MAGLGALVKLLRRTLLPSVEETGLLPRRYYVNFALDALAEDDMDEAVRCLELARSGAKSSRWRLVAQQVIFRLRVLKGLHNRELKWLGEKMAASPDPELRGRMEELARAQNRAVAILSDYELRMLAALREG